MKHQARCLMEPLSGKHSWKWYLIHHVVSIPTVNDPLSMKDSLSHFLTHCWYLPVNRSIFFAEFPTISYHAPPWSGWFPQHGSSWPQRAGFSAFQNASKHTPQTSTLKRLPPGGFWCLLDFLDLTKKTTTEKLGGSSYLSSGWVPSNPIPSMVMVYWPTFIYHMLPIKKPTKRCW